MIPIITILIIRNEQYVMIVIVIHSDGDGDSDGDNGTNNNNNNNSDHNSISGINDITNNNT